MNPGVHSYTAHEELGDLFEFWSPRSILEYVKSVARGFDALNTDITAYRTSVFDSTQSKAWGIVYTSFKKFEQDTGFFAALSLGALRTAEEYARQLAYWREQYEKRAGREATGSVVSIPSAQQEVSVNKLLFVGGIALGAYLLVQGMQFIPRSRYG